MVATLEWRPVTIDAENLSQIRIRDLQHALEIEVVGIEYAGARILHRPHDPAKHARGHLYARGVVERRKLARFVHRDLRAVPIRSASVPHEQRAELVEPVADFVHPFSALL